MAKPKPSGQKFKSLPLKLPSIMVAAVGLHAEKFAGGNESEAARSLMAEGMAAKLRAAGIDPHFTDGQTHGQISRIYFNFIDATAEDRGGAFEGRPPVHYLARPPLGGRWEQLGVRGYGVLMRGTRYNADDVEAGDPGPEVVTLADMFRGLRSSNIVVRIEAGTNLVKSLSAGLLISGMGPDDIEHGAGKDLSDLIGKGMAGDTAAVDQLERVLTDDGTKAAATPPENPKGPAPAGVDPEGPAVKALVAKHTPTALLNMLAGGAPPLTPRRRREVVTAFYVAVHNRCGECALDNLESLKEHYHGIFWSHPCAIEDAREWMALNLGNIGEPA